MKCARTIAILGVQVFSLFLLVQTQLIADDSEIPATDPVLNSVCDPATAVTESEREKLISKLRISKAGERIIENFKVRYGGLDRLLIQWDSISYSKVATVKEIASRAPASVQNQANKIGDAICVHLTHDLPEIEHIADLAHELTHATELQPRVLKGEVDDAEEFVRLRLGARGGEAHAFAQECLVKKEILGEWDKLCGPYVEDDKFLVRRVIDDFYAGKLSASLTGEPYPKMLARQYRAMLQKRDRAPVSGIENKVEND